MTDYAMPHRRARDEQGNGLMSLGCAIMLAPVLIFLVILFFSMIAVMFGAGD